jgi:hypothetical protein
VENFLNGQVIENSTPIPWRDPIEVEAASGEAWRKGVTVHRTLVYVGKSAPLPSPPGQVDLSQKHGTEFFSRVNGGEASGWVLAPKGQ